MSALIGQVGARSGIVGSTTDSTQLDYEEGYWVPTVSGATSGTFTLNTAGSSATCAYTKVGRVVNIQGLVGVISGSVSGAIYMSLPFSPATLTHDADFAFGYLYLANNGNTIAGVKNLFVQSGGAYFNSVADDGTQAYITGSNVDTVFQFGFSMSYIAA